MNLALNTPTLSPAQDLEDLCRRVPAFFQLDTPELITQATSTGWVKVQSRDLLVDAGLGLESGGLSILDGEDTLIESETTGSSFEAVCRYCIQFDAMMVNSLNVGRGIYATAHVTLLRVGQTSDGCEAYARSMGEAAVLALSRALRIWGTA